MEGVMGVVMEGCDGSGDRVCDGVVMGGCGEW